MNAAPRAGVPAVLSLALLEALRALDVPSADPIGDDDHRDVVTKRLGLSRTVEAQIARLDDLTRRGASVPGQDFAALQRLVARRPDAALVFSDAGRRAARRALADLPASARLLARVTPGGVARRVARATFGVSVEEAEGAVRAVLSGGLAVASEPGPACSLLGAGLAELLRRLTDFEGAMVHTACRGHGAPECVWSGVATATVGERSA